MGLATLSAAVHAGALGCGTGSGDARVSGNASDLLLFLYNRLPVDRIEVTGDDSLLRRWTAGVRL